MDSSSPMTNSCVHCQQSSSEPLRSGWKSRIGGYAQLCHRCYSIYKAGQFCETFHGHEQGWRDCNSCKKLFHCGCIVSLSDYSMDDFGGIVCVECSKTKFLLAIHCATSGSNPQQLEAQSNSTAPQSVLIPLFEKLMTDNDAKFRNCRIIIPKEHAKAYFPEVPNNGNAIPLNVLDTDGNGWDTLYRCWVYSRKTRYVLQGLKDFMKSKNMQPGDTVIFYRRQPDGKIILELKKTAVVTSSSHQSLMSGVANLSL